MYFDDFLNRLRKDGPPSLVLFFGDSESVIAEAWRNLREKFLQAHPQGTVSVFDGNESSLGEVLAAAQTSSLFAGAQLLVLKRAGKALGGRSDAALQQLKEYGANPNPDNHLVLQAEGMRKTAKAVAAAERMGWAVQCSDMPEWKLSGWLRQQAQGRGIGLTEEGAQLLVQKIGTDLAYLQRALEQLVLYVYPQKNIPAQAVRELPVPGLESEIFPFLDAVGLRRTDKALRMLNQMQEGTDVGTVMMLYQRFRELLLIALGRAGGLGQSELSEKLGLHPFRLKNLWEQSGQFTPPELKGALLDLIHLQAGIVTGRLGRGVPALSLECWLLKWGKRRSAVRS